MVGYLGPRHLVTAAAIGYTVYRESRQRDSYTLGLAFLASSHYLHIRSFASI
jgi:hypothetical protein